MNTLRTFIRQILNEGDEQDNPLVGQRPLSGGAFKALQATLVDKDSLSPDEITALDGALGFLAAYKQGAIFTDVAKEMEKIGSFGTGGEGFAGMIQEDDVRERANALYNLLDKDANDAAGGGTAGETGSNSAKAGLETTYNYPWRAALFIISYQQGVYKNPIQFFKSIWNTTETTISSRAAELEQAAAATAAERGIGTQEPIQEAKRIQNTLKEGLTAIGLHAIGYALYRGIMKKAVLGRTLRAFLEDDNLWKAIWDAGSGGAPAGVSSVKGTPVPVATVPALDESMWALWKLVTGAHRPTIRSGVSMIEVAVARMNATVPDMLKIDPYDLALAARKAVADGQAARRSSPTEEEVIKDVSEGLAAAAQKLASANKISPKTARAIEAIQKAAASTATTTGASVDVILTDGTTVRISPATLTQMKAVVADCGKGMAKIVKVLPNERTYAKFLHVGEIISMVSLAHEVYDTFYVGTAHVPSSFTAEDITAVCVGSKIRKLAVEEMTKCKSLSEDALPAVSGPDGALLDIFQSPANYDVTSEVMDSLSRRYLSVSIGDQSDEEDADK
jgi:hypothetical protein